MLKITRTTLLEGFHDSPFLWVPINWSNIALIWSEADILGPGCQSEIKASDINSCPKIPPNSGADDSKPKTKLFYHICLLWREIILLSLNAKSDHVDATWQLKQARAAAIVDHRLFWLLLILLTQIFPPKNGSKGKIRKTTIGEILERAAAVADPRRSIPCRLGLPRRPLSAGEDDISFAFISTEGALRRPMTCDGHPNRMIRSIPIPKPIAQQRPEDCRRPRTTSNEVRWNMLN